MIAKSRTIPRREGAAFLRYTTGAIIVKVKGSHDKDGVYRIIDGQKDESANKMTINGAPDFYVGKPVVAVNGDVFEITCKYRRLSGERMTVTELILLGIPLDIRSMSDAGWGALPGIGPSLAKQINLYSQKNGGISSVDELGELPGVGVGKIKKIRSFFDNR